MHNLKSKILILMAPLLLVFSLSPALVSADAKTDIQCGVNQASGKDCNATSNPDTTVNATVRTVINLMSVIVGIVAVIMIILGGFRYITSAGAAEKVSGAKNTILYAIIGLIIVALAQVIVRYVLTKATHT
jgi:hypothetical protein